MSCRKLFLANFNRVEVLVKGAVFCIVKKEVVLSIKDALADLLPHGVVNAEMFLPKFLHINLARFENCIMSQYRPYLLWYLVIFLARDHNVHPVWFATLVTRSTQVPHVVYDSAHVWSDIGSFELVDLVVND